MTQGGKREGANMGVLRVDHPDIRDFIHAKDDGRTAQHFNISVAVTDAFMEAARAGESYTLHDPRSGETRGAADAGAVLDEIARSAWRTGDPGLVFLDEINRHNPTPELGEIEATNPCGEVPLLPWEACTLGSINVARFWDAEAGDLDWSALHETAALGVRFLDDVVDANRFPIEEIAEAVRGNRKIGLGIMGFADLLIARRHPLRLGGGARARRAARGVSWAGPPTRPRRRWPTRRAPSPTGNARCTRAATATATPRAPASPPPARSRSSPAPPRASSRSSRSRTSGAWAMARC